MKRMTIIIYPAFAMFAFGCFALLPKAQAVSPAPDGGYPGGSTAEVQNALFSLTTGAYNTAIGFLLLSSNTDGQFNTGLGAGALLANISDSNTATGAGATAIGHVALRDNTGDDNTATGAFALKNNTTGSHNAATGASALEGNTTASFNTATGALALRNNTTGENNTANGGTALQNNTTGNGNTAIGVGALLSNMAGGANTAEGVGALGGNVNGTFNTAIGDSALFNSTSGSFNIALGSGAGLNVTTAGNVICIGTDGNNVDNSCYIGQIFGATSSGGTAVFINSNGRLGTMTSSQRFKESIKPIGAASEALLALKPVTFRYKREIDPEGDGKPQFGLVAEDVEKVNPDLVVRDKEGKPYSVRYDQVNAMLLNEFLKEHRKVEELEATLTRQQKSFESKLTEQEKRIAVLTSGLQRVSARLVFTKTSTN
jgi:hypothetical protein